MGVGMVALERDGPGAREKAKKESCMQEQRKERSTTYLVNATRNNEQGDFTNGKTKLVPAMLLRQAHKVSYQIVRRENVHIETCSFRNIA